MWRILTCVLLGAFLLVLSQQVAFAQQQDAAEWVRLYDRWKETQDAEEKLKLGEQVLTLEPVLKDWPLLAARERVKGELWFELGYGYANRIPGERADNLEKAIAAYEAALPSFILSAMVGEWATTQNNLGIAYVNRILGERGENLERAMAAFEAVLMVRTREAQPREWAGTQNNLAVAYATRIRGDRADNMEKAIAAYEAALTVRTREALPNEWADTQNNLANAFRSRIRGDRADNLEKAIAAYEAALTVVTREAMPHEWADTQNNVGIAYRDRIRGEWADNLEKAIDAFKAALMVRTREAQPRQWAYTQNHLASAYRNRIRGDHSDNLEKAITAYGAALTVFTREAHPREWAETQNDLAGAYWNRIRGERADNLERAIGAFEAALTFFTRDAFPREWATTQNNLAVAYQNRIRGGEYANNLEKAIAAFEATLTVFTREVLPREWAGTQNGIAIAYMFRIGGERADNLEKAIAALEASLTVRTRETLPRDWAETQHNLAGAYWSRIRGERAGNLERAIGAFEAALTVITREAFPREWAAAKSNLANAYQNRIRGDRADNLEKAIDAYEAALAVRTRVALPREWAETHNNLAAAYGNRIRGDRADNLEKAIGASEAALTIRTREALPREWATTQYNIANTLIERIRGDRADNLERATTHLKAAIAITTREALPREHLRNERLLGSALLEARKWHEAGMAYARARETFLLLFGQGLNDAEARELITEAGPLFAEAAFAAAQLGNSGSALTFASEGRARLMTVALKLQGLDIPAKDRQRLDALRTAIRVEERAVEGTQGVVRAAAVEKLSDLRQELLRFVKDAAAENRAGSTTLAQAHAAVATPGAIVVPILTKVGAKVIIATAPSAKSPSARRPLSPLLTVIDLPELTTDRLNLLLRGDGRTGGWLAAYKVNTLPETERSLRWPEWLAAIGRLGPELWRLFGARVNEALKEHGIKTGARLIWLPTGALGILPLGLAQDPVTKRWLADDYEIVYAPSLEALATAQKQVANPTDATLAAIVNPTGDLSGTEKEGRLVASHFQAKVRTVLELSAATPDAVLAALKGKTHWHFASHGTFSWEDARQSALIMHDHARLSVGRLLETDGLGRPRLVVLSACETGLYDINSNPDEFIGLPGTFTALGAAGVLGTLWPVSDAATALLIAKFYELHMGQKLSPPTALNRAQKWLRQATDADLVAYSGAAAKQGRLESRHVAEVEQELSEEGLNRSRNRTLIEWIEPDASAAAGKKKAASAARRVARPYAHPYYWAGFIYTGL